ncbi:translation elongation factor 4 [Planctomycetota bacterium]
MRPHELIRNFCIIAHIDHGKSTLADRILLETGAITERDFKEQLLDNMDIERERGITIKSSAVTVPYKKDKKTYSLNLIDTPGHVDFSAEVVKSLRACEGSILLVDASQGIEAQTVANMYHALDLDMEIIPVINKIDLPSARTAEVEEEIVHTLGCSKEDILHVSAKTGKGVYDVLDAVVERIPPPSTNELEYTRGLVFDSVYDEYRGVILFVRIYNGSLVKGRGFLVKGQQEFDILEIGKFRPLMKEEKVLSEGDVGYAITNIKSLQDIDVGDTLAAGKTESPEPLDGFRVLKPMVYCTLLPSDFQDFEALRQSLSRLSLNDSSFTYEPESLGNLGQGFRCGFLGLLHLDIIQERLDREYGMSLVKTAPSVDYKLIMTDDTVIEIKKPSDMPDKTKYIEILEPFVKLSVICPHEHIGTVMDLTMGKLGKYKSTEYLTPLRVLIIFEISLSEIIFDYYNKLKNCTRGYGTMDYEVLEYRPNELMKLDILVNGSVVDPFAVIVNQKKAARIGRKILLALKRNIPRHLFKIPLQAAIGNKIIAREDISPLRKNVTAKCYGGDISRKRKLLEKQKEGKKKMKSIGRVEVPQEAFLSILEVTTGEL